MRTAATTVALALLSTSGVLDRVAPCAAQPPPTQRRLPLTEGAPQWVTPAIQAPRLKHRTFHSQAVQSDVSYHIYTPEAYDADQERRLPVLYWLHGAGGGLPGLAPLSAHFGDAMRAGDIPPMLVVFPNGLNLSLWVDSKDGSVPMETVVVTELLPHIDATFRTIASRDGRLVEGFSMGGYGAARLGLKHDDLFGAVSILSGGPLQEEFTDTPRVGKRGREWVWKTIFGGDAAYFAALSPWVLAERNAAAVREQTTMRLVIGERDEMLAVNEAFHAHLVELQIPHTFTILPGVGHSTPRVFEALGEANWEFYRTVFGAPEPGDEEAWPGGPRLKAMSPGDASADAAGRGQLFESIAIPGFTDVQEGTNGLAVADLNRDGLLDIVATYSGPRGSGGAWGAGEKLRVFLNEGDFRYREHAIKLADSDATLDAFGRGQVPVLADFNRDGFLDLFVTRHAPMQAGENRRGVPLQGNSLFVTDGSWDSFRDVSERMGIRNELAYNRQPCFGDVNRDGWLDIAVGCDNIGNAMGGFPHSRLYVFRPNGDRFEDGAFEDIGGTELVPDFGGFYHDSTRDKAGPDINLVDLDNDGDLDLLQSYHVDVRAPLLPYSPGEYRQGAFCWRNMLVETGEFRFEKVTDNGLACVGQLRYNEGTQVYEPTGKAPGLPYISTADVDNDGLLDVLAVGPADPGWAPRVEYVHGRLWRNLGEFRFQETTEQAGLGPLNWHYRQWYAFWGADIPARLVNWRPRARGLQGQPGLQPRNPLDGRGFYAADALFGDFDNDGWVDLVVLDRTESLDPGACRAMLFTNRGDGTFEVKPTTFSGIDSSGICGQVADLNNDGLLDIVFAADPDNSGVAASGERYRDKVYWNTGLHGARENHWLRLRFSGVGDAELIGARVEAREPASGKLLGMRVVCADDSYKSGCPLEVHFGLGVQERVDVRVAPLGRTAFELEGVAVDRSIDLDPESGTPVG
jgi:enterochelin esterase-like enzyme